MREPDRKPWFIGVGALALAALACTCGPLAGLTGQIEATAESAMTVAVEQVATAVVEAATEAPPAPTQPAPTEEPPPTESGPPGGQVLNQWATSATASTQFADASWSAMQASGPPDTTECGDITTAWASATSNGVDWLRLEYAVAVVPTQISIYQTFNPSAVNLVEVTDTNGITYPVYEATPAPAAPCPFVLVVNVTGITAPVQTVTVHIDQTNHTGWNEIDAVELVGAAP